MNKWLAGIIVIVFSGVCLAEEAKVNFDQKGSVGKIVETLAAPEAALPAPVATAGKPTAKEWTVMVYVNAKNNLEMYGMRDINEMEMVGSSSKVNIVAELGRIDGYDTSDGNWTGSRRYLIKKDANTSKISSPVLQDIAKTDMGDWNHLVEFATWAKTNFPAKHYMLVVWNHGSGWSKDAGFASIKGISYDDETGNHITTPQLGQALAAIGKVDVYGSDACLMQMAEVAYEIKDYADIIVDSEETEPGDGYTYNTLLDPLVANPAMSAEELGTTAVNSYCDHYTSINQGATQSVVRSSALPGFLTLVNDWTALAMQSNEKTLYKNARNSALSFAEPNSKDLYDFLSIVTKGTKNAALAQKGQELMTYIEKDLVILNRSVTDAYANAHGMAINIPSYYNSAYDDLAWAKDGKWDEFLKWLK